MTWNAHHTRTEVLRTVGAAADARLDGGLPLDVPGARPGAAPEGDGVFVDELDLLGALQLRWHTRLAGRIDRALMDQPLDLEAAVIGAWREVAEELPGVRLVLDRQRENADDARTAAALEAAAAKEQAMLAVLAGLAGTQDTRAAAVGAVVESRARAGRRPVGRRRVSDAGSRGRRTGLLDRIRSLAA